MSKGEDPSRTHQGSPLAGYAMFFFRPFSHVNGNKLIGGLITNLM